MSVLKCWTVSWRAWTCSYRSLVSRVQCARRSAGWQTSSTWRMGRDQGSVGGRGCRGGYCHFKECSAGVPGYVTVIIMRGRLWLPVCQPLTVSPLSYNSSWVTKWCESLLVTDALQISVSTFIVARYGANLTGLCPNKWIILVAMLRNAAERTYKLIYSTATINLKPVVQFSFMLSL